MILRARKGNSTEVHFAGPLDAILGKSCLLTVAIADCFSLWRGLQNWIFAPSNFSRGFWGFRDPVSG
jgi:hypothetical protein